MQRKKKQKGNIKERKSAVKEVKLDSKTAPEEEAKRTLDLRLQILASGLSHKTRASTINALVSQFGGIIIGSSIPGSADALSGNMTNLVTLIKDN